MNSAAAALEAKLLQTRTDDGCLWRAEKGATALKLLFFVLSFKALSTEAPSGRRGSGRRGQGQPTHRCSSQSSRWGVVKMFGRWKLTNSFVKTSADSISPSATFSSIDVPQHNETTATSEKTFLRKAHYFCLIQTTPSPSTFVFAEPGDYIIGCSCTNGLSGTLVPVPLGPYPEYRGTCGYLRIKVRDRIISVRQLPPVAASPFQGNCCGAPQFFKETGRGYEVFSHLDSAENCKFRMTLKNGIDVNSRTAGSNDGFVCSFSFRRILLGIDRPNVIRRGRPNTIAEAPGNSTTDDNSLFTEYQLPVSRRFELFLDARLGKGGNGEVFLAMDRRQGVPVAIKREPKEMLRHEFSLICDIRIEGSLVTYAAQDPHPSKFLGLMAHSVALEVGNSAVAAAVAHHSAIGDSHDHLALELVNGGELRKLLKAKYPTGMPFIPTGKGYSYGVDIWALGTIFFELLTGERLFECLNMNDAMEFLLKCLTKDPQKRPTAFQLLTSPFLFPFHIYQMRRRFEATDVYTSYMQAFEKGWGNLKPMEVLSMAEKLSYDSSTKSFFAEFPDPEAVNVVLPVFECVPDFQSQEREMRISNWVLASDASFYLAPKKVDRNSNGGQVGASAHSTHRNSPVLSFTSDESSQDAGENFLSPSFNKILPDTQYIYPHPNGLMTCGLGVPPRGSTCSTSIGTPVHGALVFGGAEKLAGGDEAFETLANRIDSL
ncbi:uncharacterized protein EMH_0018290 [Eimeria mitis]|uniref:non-specific serine/threonine protein kinase n=1 Tax=Eimeria mitis TaxID=44415 RepID=U6K7K7_9EIME|nr:uncharacterized protein EMH_0018290 [Eimeria mitis]CDJ33985.1 hypothetical protein, conserved [Eimeria mitis]